MSTVTSSLVARLIDRITGPARTAAGSIGGIGRAVDALNRRRLLVGDALYHSTRQIGRSAARLREHAVGTSAAFSIPLGLAGRFGAGAVYELEKTGNALQAVTGISDEHRAKILAHAKALNALFPATNSGIMSSAYELGRAGLKYEQIMGGLTGNLEIALAGDLTPQEAADISTNILTAMRLPQKTTEQVAASLARVNDALAYVATNSNTDVRMMGETFKYVGPIAAAAGLSVEEIAAASMMMAKNGIRASEAGVAMRSAIVRMVRPTKPMIAALERLNLNVSDFVKGGRQIKGIDIVKSLLGDGVDASAFEGEIDAALADATLKKSTAAMTAKIASIIEKGGSAVDRKVLSDAIQDTLTSAGSEVDFFGFISALNEKGVDVSGIARIFDARQGSRLATLFAGDLNKTLEEVIAKSPGSAASMAKIRMKGVVGVVAEAGAAWENLFVAIAESGVLEAATDVIKFVTNTLTSLAEINPTALKLGTYAAGALFVLGPLGLALGGVASLFGTLYGSLALITKFGGGAIAVMKAIAGITATTAAAGAAGAAGAAAGTAGTAAAGAAAGAAGRGALRSVLGRAGLWGAIGLGLYEAGSYGYDLLKKEAADSRRAGAPSSDFTGKDVSLAATGGFNGAEYLQSTGRFEPINPVSGNMMKGNLRNLPGAWDASALEQGAEARAAGQSTMSSFGDGLEAEMAAIEAQADAFVARLKAKLSFTARPSIAMPTGFGGTLRSLHADTGIE